MLKKGNILSRFWQEIKRRNVHRTLALYAGTAFVILEASTLIFPRWGLPDWTDSVRSDAIEESSFTNHTLQLKPGDIVYLFSDGYPDQFGGLEDKKFKYGPFRELLIRISDMGMEAQRKELDRVMNAWKGKEFQVDDILVFGIRFI